MTKTFKFTLKTTSITNDSLYSYKTKIIELAPGDEVFIGNKNEVSKIEYPYKNISVLQTHPIDTSGNIPLPKGYKKLSEFAAIFRESIKGRDTIINGEHLKYTYSTVTIKDTLHPYPINYYKHQYEVTGQVEVKLKAQDAKDRQQ